MGLILTYQEGQTPLDPEQINGLKIKTISTQQQLNEFEQTNIAATWEFKKVRYNHFDSTSEYGDYTWEMRKDGTFRLNSKGRQAYIIFPGKVDIGKWDFVLDKEAIDFRYDDGRIERYNIKRLTAKDLWMEFIDSGDTRYIELSRKKWDLGK